MSRSPQRNTLRNKVLSHLLLMPLALAFILLSASAAVPDALYAAPDALLVVDHNGDASGLACDSGVDNDCSLRSAIEHANSSPGVDSIIFESEEGDMTITLTSPLPTLTDDDTTIAPLDPDQVIEVDANNANGNVFEITGSDIRIEGMRLYGSGNGWANIYIHGAAQGIAIANNFIGDDQPGPGGCGQSPNSYSGIFISSTGSTPSGARAWIYGNTIKCHEGDPGVGIVITGSGADDVFIGENDGGDATNDEQNLIRGNAGDGVLIQDGAANNVVRNTRLIDNAGYGIRLTNGDLNEIFGNTIAGNGSDGVMIESGSESNRLGCPLLDPVPAIERNVIRDNGGVGVHLTGEDTAINTLLCNWIGTSNDGASAAPNVSHGVLIDGGAHNNNVGATMNTANTISGNGGDGVRISGSDDNLVLGNYIGVNDGGGAAIANGVSGVSLVSGASDNVIGSATSDDAGNVISGNLQTGVLVANVGSTGNRIDGNHIGVGVDGMTALPNGTDGISVFGAGGTAIGPSDSDTEQLIHHNDGAGVRIHDGDGALIGTANTVQHNGEAGIVVTGNSVGLNVHVQAVYGNGGLPVDLGDDGYTPNDPGDGDSGPNTLLNYPIITGSSGDTIEGTACVCTVHIYEAVGDPSAPGGGGVFLHSVATDGSGNWSATLPDGLTRFDVTVLAVDASLNSSEMAPRPRIVLPIVLNP